MITTGVSIEPDPFGSGYVATRVRETDAVNDMPHDVLPKAAVPHKLEPAIVLPRMADNMTNPPAAKEMRRA